MVDKNIPAKDHMPDKNQKSPKFPAHEREEELIVYAKFRIDAQDYHTPPFYGYSGKIQDKYEFTK